MEQPHQFASAASSSSSSRGGQFGWPNGFRPSEAPGATEPAADAPFEAPGMRVAACISGGTGPAVPCTSAPRRLAA
eukprot:15230387-Alexandrium_andersonii.AAC.1